jgi:hypothetical protein
LANDSSSSSPLSALASPAAPALEKKPETLVRSRAGGQLGQLAALSRQDAEEAIGIAQHRVGAFDDLLDVLAPRRQAGAQFVEDETEALRVGQALDVVDQVRVDAGAVVLHRQQVLAGPGLVV